MDLLGPVLIAVAFVCIIAITPDPSKYNNEEEDDR